MATDHQVFPETPSQQPQDAPGGPLRAFGWVCVATACLCAPAVVWAVWRWAL